MLIGEKGNSYKFSLCLRGIHKLHMRKSPRRNEDKNKKDSAGKAKSQKQRRNGVKYDLYNAFSNLFSNCCRAVSSVYEGT